MLRTGFHVNINDHSPNGHEFYQDLCNLVDSYVRGVRAGRSPAAAAEVLSRLPAITSGFSQSVNMLYTYLQSSRLQDANKAPHLRQLYMRLNYNGFVGGSMTQRVLQAGVE